MALVVLIGWQALVLASIVLTSVVIWRRRAAGIPWGVALVAGAILSFGFVSAAAGLGEGTWSVSSAGFLMAVGIGGLGLMSFVGGSLGLRKR